MSQIQLILGDCLEKMQEIPDGSIDMILCDLPYGTTACSWDTVIPFEPLWAHYKRLIKENGAIVLFGSQPFTTDLIQSNKKWFRYEWIWEKNTSGGFVTVHLRPMKYHENILVFYLAQPVYNPQFENYSLSTMNRFKDGETNNSSKAQREKKSNKINNAPAVNGKYEISRGCHPKTILTFPLPNAGSRIHPTQKPVPLCEYLIRTYTNEGEMVLDNCMGSGTTGVACIHTNRNFIGIEKDEEYFNIAKRRIESAQLPLFS